MKNKSFEELIEKLQNNNLDQINKAWKEAKNEKNKANKISITTCIIADVIVLYFILNSIKNFYATINISIINILVFLIIFIIIDVVIFVFISMIFNKKQSNYKQLFKEVIIKELINNFYNNSAYLPTSKMPSTVYDEAKYKEYYNIYNSEDYIEAKIDNKYQINMAEVKTQEEESRTDSDGNTHTTTITKFHGIFSKIVIDKSINSELRIERNNTHLWNKKKLEMDSRTI